LRLTLVTGAFMFAAEWAILKSASIGLRRLIAVPVCDPRAYVEKNFLGMLGVVLALGALPEIPFHHLLMPSRDWLAGFALDFVVVYAAVWVLGVYGVMVQRPHEMQADRIIFHRGPFAHVEIPRHAIERAVAVTEAGREARKRYSGAHYMGMPGASLVYIRLREPVRVAHTYPVQHERMVRELLVPSDHPGGLCAMLEP
jgi:hypothetical protein